MMYAVVVGSVFVIAHLVCFCSAVVFLCSSLRPFLFGNYLTEEEERVCYFTLSVVMLPC